MYIFSIYPLYSVFSPVYIHTRICIAIPEKNTMLISFLLTKYTHLETYLDMKGSPGLLSAGLQMYLHTIVIINAVIKCSRKLLIDLQHSVGSKFRVRMLLYQFRFHMQKII
jgi:hypothetical protein